MYKQIFWNLTNFLTLNSFFRIVRNKAAEKAKHVHQQSQSSGTPPGLWRFIYCRFIFNLKILPLGHLPQSPQMTSTDPQDSNGATPNSVNGSEGRISSGYSINGILGIQHANELNVNSMKRKRVDDHGRLNFFCNNLKVTKRMLNTENSFWQKLRNNLKDNRTLVLSSFHILPLHSAQFYSCRVVFQERDAKWPKSLLKILFPSLYCRLLSWWWTKA